MRTHILQSAMSASWCCGLFVVVSVLYGQVDGSIPIVINTWSFTNATERGREV